MSNNKMSVNEQVTREATFGTLPVRKNERQYGLLDAFLILSGYGAQHQLLSKPQQPSQQ